MAHTSTLDFRAEERRIRNAYARRQVSGRYSWFAPDHMRAIQERERLTLNLLKRHGFTPLDGVRIFEVGCGNGFWLREFIKWGALPEHLVGIDLLEERIEQAHRLCPPHVRLFSGNAAGGVVPDESFDIVLQSMLLTSVLDPALRKEVARAMWKAVRPGGGVLWYDYRVDNPWNPDVRGVSRSEVAALFPEGDFDLHRTTLIAPLARVVLRRVPFMYPVLRPLPPLRSHYLGLIRKPK